MNRLTETSSFWCNRRTVLSLGLGTLLGHTSFAKVRQNPSSKPNRSCILIWLGGGASHIDTFDPKPDADSGIRGEFKTIDTALPGVRLSEIMPNLARVLDHTVLIRSLTSPEADHDRASHHVLTGWRPNPALVYPSLGSIYSKHYGGIHGTLPNHVAIPSKPLFSGSGYLSSSFDPLDIPGDPAQPNFRVRDLSPPDKLTYDRLQRRRSMVQSLNSRSTAGDSQFTKSREEFDRQTFTILTNASTQKAFQLQDESGPTRDIYGRNSLGQSLLLARRLIERGVGYITVNDRSGGLGWDTHAQNFPSLRDRLMPPLDQGVAALIADLDSRGLLDQTLVVVCGEFGRTPKINPQAGRDHHGRASSILLAGCGLKKGIVFGSTDRNAVAPVTNAVTPAQLCATVLSILGIDPETRIQSPDGRPLPLVDHAVPITEILA